MLIRIGTNKYYVSIGLMYYYNKGKVLNLFELCTSTFAFVIKLWKPMIYVAFRERMWQVTKHGIEKW